MKKLGLIFILFMLFSAVSGADGLKDDKKFQRGLKHYNSKNYTAAVTQFQKYVNERPDPAAYYLLGYSLYELGKFSEAEEYFRESYLIDPDFSLEQTGLIKKTTKEIMAKEAAAPKQTVAAPAIKPAAPNAVKKELQLLTK